jgi:hypothetical protein
MIHQRVFDFLLFPRDCMYIFFVFMGTNCNVFFFLATDAALQEVTIGNRLFLFWF